MLRSYGPELQHVHARAQRLGHSKILIGGHQHRGHVLAQIHPLPQQGQTVLDLVDLVDDHEQRAIVEV